MNEGANVSYVAPYDCVVSVYVVSGCRHLGIVYRGRFFTLSRTTGTPEDNLSVSMRFSKGQEFQLRYLGTGVSLGIYTVSPN